MTMAAGPAAPAPVVTMSCPASTELTAAGVPPTVTVTPVTKLPPVMVMRVPPPAGPLVGFTALNVGAGPVKVNPAGRVVLSGPGFVTTIAAGPTAPVGVVQSSRIVPVSTAATWVPPIITVAPAAKFVPLIEIAVPPVLGPDVVGVIDVICGPPV